MRAAPAILFVLATASGCVVADHDDGITVSLGMVHHFHRDPTVQNLDGAPRTFTNGEGDEITLTRGYLVVTAAEIRGCDDGAIAHTIGTPTLLEVKSGDDLMRADTKALALGAITPPPGTYCAVRLTFGPADADTLGLPADVAGKTLSLEGSWTPPGGGPARPLAITSSAIVSVDIPFRDPNGLVDVPLVLDAEHLGVDVTFATAYDEWFDQIDLGWTLPDELDERVMANVLTSVHEHAAGTSPL